METGLLIAYRTVGRITIETALVNCSNFSAYFSRYFSVACTVKKKNCQIWNLFQKLFICVWVHVSMLSSLSPFKAVDREGDPITYKIQSGDMKGNFILQQK